MRFMSETKLHELLPKISVVVPTYKSLRWIASYIDELCAEIQNNFSDYEILVVNDYCGDEKLITLLQKKQSENAKVKVIFCSERIGQQQATWLGIKQAQNDLVVTIDDDGEYPPSQILKLCNKWKETKCELVYGIPKTLKQEGIKILLYKLYLYNLQRKGEARKSSFRLISSSLLSKIKNSIELMPNMDVFFESLNTPTAYQIVSYTPKKGSRYNLWDYFRLLWIAVTYKARLQHSKQ